MTRAALTEVVYTLEIYYRSSRAEIGRALDALLSLQRVSIEDGAVTARAVSWYKGGMDFGDAMIAASSHGARASRPSTVILPASRASSGPHPRFSSRLNDRQIVISFDALRVDFAAESGVTDDS